MTLLMLQVQVDDAMERRTTLIELPPNAPIPFQLTDEALEVLE